MLLGLEPTGTSTVSEAVIKLATDVRHSAQERLYRSASDVERAMSAWMSGLNVEISLKRTKWRLGVQNTMSCRVKPLT